MGILIRKHFGTWAFTGVAKLAFVFFFSSLSVALINTIWAVYLQGFFHSDVYVGFFSGFLSILAFLSFFFFVPLIEKSNKVHLYSTVILFTAIIYVLFGINKNFVIFVLLGIVATLLASIRITVSGILVKDKSNKKSLSANEGFVYAFVNLAWVIGPLIAGLILVSYGESYIFFSSAFLICLSLILFKISNVHDGNITKNTHNHVLRNFFDFFRSKDRVVAYITSLGVSFWWALIYLYMPLFMIENGFKESSIGIFLFAVAFPLIILEYPMSKSAGKNGSKKFFLWGFLFVSIISFSAFFVGNNYLILGLMALGSVGMAMLEPTTESYFFDIFRSKKQSDRFYGPYNTSAEIGLVLGKLAPATLLLFLPFKYIFLVFAGFMFLFFLVSTKARNIVERNK